MTRSGRAACALASAVLALGCRARPGGERPAPQASASVRTPGERGALELVAERKHDFGRVLQGETLRYAFVTRNPTPAPVTVEETREVLGCSGRAVPRELAPGASGRLEVTCRATIYGPLRVSLPLRADGRAAGEVALVAEVEPLLAFDRALLEVHAAFGAGGSAEARLVGARASAARLVPVTSLPDGVTAAVLAPSDGGPQRVSLRVSKAAAGTHAGSLRLATNLAEPKTIELGYLVKVPSTLAISPSNPVLNLGAPAGTQTFVRVTSQRPGFRVERVDVIEGPFEARLRREGEAYVVGVSVNAGAVPRGMRGANGRLLIVSNDHAEPNKELPLFALGSPPARAPALPSEPSRSADHDLLR